MLLHVFDYRRRITNIAAIGQYHHAKCHAPISLQATPRRAGICQLVADFPFRYFHIDADSGAI